MKSPTSPLFIRCAIALIFYNQPQSALNLDIICILCNSLWIFLRNLQLQSAIFKSCFDILLFYIFSHIKTSAAGTCITFPPDVHSVTVFFIILGSGYSTDRQIAVFQFCFYVFLFHTRKIHCHFIDISQILDVCPHHFRRIRTEMVAVMRAIKKVIQTGDILVLCLSPIASASLPNSAGEFRMFH